MADKGSVLLPEYISNYFEEDSKLDWNLCEDDFSIPMDTCIGEVPFNGRYDGGFIRSGRQWLFETKFKARYNEGYIDGLGLDLQVCSYMVSMRYNKMDIAGALFNIVRKPGQRQTQKQTLADYRLKIKDDIAARPEHYFERIEIQLTNREMAEAELRLRYLVDEYCKWWLEAKSQIKLKDRDLMFNSSACDGKYGDCDYMPICTRGCTSEFKKTLQKN